MLLWSALIAFKTERVADTEVQMNKCPYGVQGEQAEQGRGSVEHIHPHTHGALYMPCYQKTKPAAPMYYGKRV